MLAAFSRRSLRRAATSLAAPTRSRTLATANEYFRPVEVTADGIAIIRLDGPEKMNTLSKGMSAEAEAMWDTEVANASNIKAAVFISSKPDNFIAGADIKMLKATENKDDLKKMCMEGHAMFDKIRAKKIPLVAAINGTCLGGGLEWALQCDYRVATSDPKTQLGLPEVMLGLLPGWGGTQNLHKLVGIQAAMKMMLAGAPVRADRAKKMGLVDLVVDGPALETTAVEHAKQLAAGTLKPKRELSFMDKFLVTPPGQKFFLWKEIEKTVAKASGGHYPAPYGIIEAVKNGLNTSDTKAALEFEADQFVKLAKTPEHQAMVGLFDGTVALKRNRFKAALPKWGRETETVVALGAGLMGAGIAQVTAEKGIKVLLKDANLEGVSKGEAYIAGNLDKKVKRRRMTKFKRNSILNNVVCLTDESPNWQKHFAQADMVIEAVPEILSLKHKVLEQAEAVIPDHCIFATNTSAIPIRDIAAGAKRPGNVIGMHYFSPVPQMKLLEVIRHEGTEDHVAAAVTQLGIKQGKFVIVVKDVPGFYVNRSLVPMLSEVYPLIQDGAGIEAIDKAVKGAGMPVGPISLMDEVGIDIGGHVVDSVGPDIGFRAEGGENPATAMLVEKNWLGRKTGKGFFVYDGKKKTINAEVVEAAKQFQQRDLKLEPQEIVDRMVCRFVNEAVRCLEDGILDTPTDGDMGAVFGVGFFPFRGGPFKMLDIVGIEKYTDMMRGFADKYESERFTPCQLQLDMAKAGKKFYN